MLPRPGTADESMLARPEGRAAADKLPVVLVVSEIFGVHEHIADVARRFARLGYLAIAPELFERQGDAQSYGEIDKLMSEVVSKVPDAQVMADLDACVAWAAANGGDTGRLGSTGFCWGGRIVWLYTAHQPKLKAGVAWYGRLSGAPSPLKPTNPIDLVRRRWWAMMLCVLIGTMSVFLVLVVSLRVTGVSSSDVSLIEVFTAWSLVRLLTALPLTPGGIGITELGLVGTLTGFGGEESKVVAAVLLFRALTVLPPIIIGALVAFTWSRRELHAPAV